MSGVEPEVRGLEPQPSAAITEPCAASLAARRDTRAECAKRLGVTSSRSGGRPATLQQIGSGSRIPSSSDKQCHADSRRHEAR